MKSMEEAVDPLTFTTCENPKRPSGIGLFANHEK